jgi:hypothetical protein
MIRSAGGKLLRHQGEPQPAMAKISTQNGTTLTLMASPPSLPLESCTSDSFAVGCERATICRTKKAYLLGGVGMSQPPPWIAVDLISEPIYNNGPLFCPV